MSDPRGTVKAMRMPPGWRKAGSFSELAASTADFNEGRGLFDGHVYFIGSADGPIKIGFTKHLHSRVRALKNSSPVKLTLLAATPGCPVLERRYHAKFAAHRLHGEWFAPAPEILEKVAELAGE